MTELEIVLIVALVVVVWAYRVAVRRADYYKTLVIAIGVGVVSIEVNEDNKTYKLGLPK
jgi:hypothetical protein